MGAYVIGFTGTRNGLSPEQRVALTLELRSAVAVHVHALRAVHGDCLGADAEFDAQCKALGIEVGVRPCTYPAMRARCDSPQLAEPKPPMARNRDIVADAHMLLACPPNDERIKRGSGTWATIKFGERKGIPLAVILPSGFVVRVTAGGRFEEP